MANGELSEANKKLFDAVRVWRKKVETLPPEEQEEIRKRQEAFLDRVVNWAAPKKEEQENNEP